MSKKSLAAAEALDNACAEIEALGDLLSELDDTPAIGPNTVRTVGMMLLERARIAKDAGEALHEEAHGHQLQVVGKP